MGVKGDAVTHTSDHFETLYNYALQMIKAGKAYTDDTQQAQVRILTLFGTNLDVAQ
jgi:glutamyl-tRNA synthetase